MAENETTTETEATEQAPAQETDWKAEARKWEQRAKDNRKEADELRAKAAKWDEAQREGMSELERATQRAEAAEAQLEAYRAEEKRRADASEVAEKTGVPASLLLHCADRADMEAFAKEYASETKVPAAPRAPESRVVRGDGAKPSTADQFAEMAERYFRH